MSVLSTTPTNATSESSENRREADRCWVSEFMPSVSYSGAIHECHIKDAIFCTPRERVDPANTLRLRSDLHSMYDARMFHIAADGGVVWDNWISDNELARLGIRRDAAIDFTLMTPARRHYVGQRITHYESWLYARKIAIAAKEKQDEENKRRYGPSGRPMHSSPYMAERDRPTPR